MRSVFMLFLLWITPELLEKNKEKSTDWVTTHTNKQTHKHTPNRSLCCNFLFPPPCPASWWLTIRMWKLTAWFVKFTHKANVFPVGCHSFFIFNHRGGVDSFLLLTFLKTNSKGGNFNSNHVLGQLLICRICSSPLQQRAGTLIWNCVRAHFISIYFSVF